LTIDGALLTSASLTFIGTAETNGTFSVVGGAGTDAITGGTGADTITGGNGADTITGGKGSDNIVLTETVAATDKVIFSGATLDLNGTDTITGFKVGQTTGDILAFTSLTSGALVNTVTSNTIALATTTVLSTEATSIPVAGNKVYVAQVATVANINTAANVITALTDGGLLDAVDVAASATAFLVLTASDDATHAYVYGVTNDATAAVATGELVLLGTVTVDSTTFTDGNFAFS
jgi:Ca2+-binding RTX toxin-like protein